jgi:hypothetical protein
MVEYAILLVGVLLIGAGAVKVLGGKVRARVDHVGDVASGGDGKGGYGASGGGGGGGSVAMGAGGGGGGGSGNVASKGGVTEGKANFANKASVGGVGDTKNGAGSGPPPSSGNGGDQPNGASPTPDDNDLGDNNFGLRKGLALAMLVMGLVSVVYFFMKTKKVVKDVKEAK